MPTKRYGRFKVKKIKKRMISAVLAMSMGMTLMPTDFTGFRAYATNEAENGSANQRTNGKYITMLGTTDDPSFGSAIINRGLADLFNGLKLWRCERCHIRCTSLLADSYRKSVTRGGF